MIVRVFYTSLSLLSLGRSSLEDLVVRSRAANRRNDVTGVLYADPTTFFHVLEGPEAVVTDLVDVIFQDARHAYPRFLLKQVSRWRMFPDQPFRLVDGTDDPRLQADFQYHDLIDLAHPSLFARAVSLGPRRVSKAVNPLQSMPQDAPTGHLQSAQSSPECHKVQ